MDGNIRRLIPLACLLGAVTVAGCSGDVASEPDGVLGVREGGQGTVMGGGGNIETLCRAMLSCVPADAVGATVDECVNQLGPYFRDLLQGAPAGCANAFDAYLACVVDNLQCTADGIADPTEACAGEQPAVVAACDGFEPNIDIEDYIQVDQTTNDQTPSDSL